MPYLDTAQQWLTQSHLLLQARPTTTRITTKYTIKAPSDPSAPRTRKSKAASTTAAEPVPTETTPTTTTQTPAQEPIRATLTLKTYDSASGSTLKYETTKAAEVSRLIQILGKLGRGMAGLPEVKEDVVMGEGVGGGEASGVATPVVGDGTSTPLGKGPQVGGGQGGKGKKKKGKK